VRIELAEGTGRGIPWVGKGVVSLFRHTTVQGVEVGEAHIHFASHDEMIRVAVGLQL